MSRKRLKKPDHPLLGQLWELKEMPIKQKRNGIWIPRPRLLKEFVKELNSWHVMRLARDRLPGQGGTKGVALRREDYKKEFSVSCVQSWFLPNRRWPSLRDAEILRRKICWVRAKRPYRCPETLRGEYTAAATRTGKSSEVSPTSASAPSGKLPEGSPSQGANEPS